MRVFTLFSLSVLVCATIATGANPAKADSVTNYYDSHGNRTGQSTTTDSSTYWGNGESTDTSTTTYNADRAEPTHQSSQPEFYSRKRK